ncbi:hypothetical protein DAEQUDRAFT_371078 [Daedalea quercina L-15889]|uniref:Uncharacterized protein n=1 Tax=Daedalea quercina L-15889 TaxID=1314783 RepID=A0A165PBH8_9APHY|nr:hypothetical protein DAEQUDRAFT_371078 [Daedalea quercina L-15889]
MSTPAVPLPAPIVPSLPVDDPSHVHGLPYAPGFLDALPVLQTRPTPHQPIRALSAAQFSRVHLDYVTTHAPDGVLFPFIHGLEGDNDQQNAFFAASPQAHAVPRFRGLIWVACDDDVNMLPSPASTPDPDTDDDIDDDSSSTSSLESLGAMSMDIDVDVSPGSPMELDPTLRDSIEANSPAPGAKVDDKPLLHALDTAPHPAAPVLVPSVPARCPPYTNPAVLTSSFRPRELLHPRTKEDGSVSCAFVDPRVPDGISLRNFGIQVPIYATLSDVVVYSPKGDVRAALALAEKFKDAIEAKRAERSVRYGCPVEALVAYNVFVLDASPAEMVKTLPHLLVRIEDVPLSHTDGTDAHTEGEPRDAQSEVEYRNRLFSVNTVDFARREKEEMRDLTQASEIITIADPEMYAEAKEGMDALSGSTPATRWNPAVGQVFLGNVNDVPIPPDRRLRARRSRSVVSPYGDEEEDDADEVFDWRTNDPAHGLGYDICIDCQDFAPFPSAAHVKAMQEHIEALERRWVERCVAELGHVPEKDAEQTCIPLRPPPSANAVIHLQFPSSPINSTGSLNALVPFIDILESLLQPPPAMTLAQARALVNPPPIETFPSSSSGHRRASTSGFHPSSLPPPSAFPASFFPSSPYPSAYTRTRSTSATFLPPSPPSSNASASSSVISSPAPSLSSSVVTTAASVAADKAPLPASFHTRPIKVLIFSADGYTESSVLALTLLMAWRKLSLPEAYLCLQNEKRRSFFVYTADVPMLKRIENRIERERERGWESMGPGMVLGPEKKQEVEEDVQSPLGLETSSEVTQDGFIPLRPVAAKSVSFAAPPAPQPATTAVTVRPLRSQSESATESVHGEADADRNAMGRPRANTMPMPRSPAPSIRDHHVWFNDPRFDGSFPSRVLPFLYLGNLNHATNAYMLHALGITHVVSVGECALLPPPNLESSASAPSCAYPGPSHAHFIPGKGPHGQGSLFVEEREGRIKVLDIKGVCDDGIDTLEPQLEPICEWIDRAREEGGKVLVHCRVGVSRSATVTIAYVMKHLSLPLVDAYLIVRSRRLSVLIQPNMRLLYNLLGWEVKLARERAGDDKDKLRVELARCLNWPYLAKEVHLLNQKYLQ